MFELKAVMVREDPSAPYSVVGSVIEHFFGCRVVKRGAGYVLQYNGGDTTYDEPTINDAEYIG